MTETLLKSLPQSPPDVEALRLYLLLPLMHFFDQGTCAQYLHVPGHLGCRMTKLEGAAGKIIGEGFEVFFLRFLTYQTCLTFAGSHSSITYNKTLCPQAYKIDIQLFE